MSKRAVHRVQTSLVTIRHLMPAWLCFALAGAIDHPVALVPVLVATAIAMTGICNAIGFAVETSFARSVARRGLAFFVLITVYTGFVAALLAAPAWWLARDGTLPAALVLSAALVLALFVLWRVWPAFALPFLWDDAYPQEDAGHSWLFIALRRCVAFAQHLTREHDLFFSHGLPAGLGLLFLAVGALVLSGFGGFLSGDMRIAALVLYAFVLAPLALGLLLNRCLRAVLANARSARHRENHIEPRPMTAVNETPALPAVVTRAELDATLLCAAYSSQISLALAALERGADPNASPAPDQRDQRSALMIAVTLPDPRLLRALIAKGADVNRLHGGITPLIAATRDSYQGRAEAVTTLLANGADARIADACGNTPLHHAARCAEPIVAALLLDAAADVNAVDADGLTALGIACGNANWDVAAFLVEHGAKPDIDRAQPALAMAAGIADDDPAGIKLLLKQRASVNGRAALERTPLMAAALAGHARIAEVLLTAGADPQLADHRGTTALMEAARSGSVSVIHALGKHKPVIDTVDSSGRSALVIACQSRQASEECVRALLALGADRTLEGADGKRALEHAAAAGRWHIVALLDAAYPLPSNLGDGAPLAQTANADHLLDALRFAHWNVVAEFSGILDEWPLAALADLYLALCAAEDEDARTWLLNHGLGGDPCTSDGHSLGEKLLDALPASTAALAQWCASGAPIGGAGVIARTLAVAPHGADGAATRAFALGLLERGGDWCGAASGQRTALHLAVSASDIELTCKLLDLGADPNARDAQGRTPLHLALSADPSSALVLLPKLIAAGASSEIATTTGETPLGMALAREQPDFAKWLNWTHWRLPLRQLRPADLPAAAAVGDLDAIDRLLELGLPIDAEDMQGATALIRAAGSGHTALVVRLLEGGADIRHVAHSGTHCLAAAVSAKREAVVRTLLNHGVAPDTRMFGGATSLTIAAALGQVRIAEALLEAGADPNASDEQGTVPLHAAAQYAFEGGDSSDARTLLDRLLRAGARMDARNLSGQDALLILLGARAQPGTRCDAEHLQQLAGFMLDHGAKTDSQDQRGVGTLHACALHGLSGCARLLKSHGAPLDLHDGFDRSAADVAALLGYVDVATELGGMRATLPSARQTLRRPARAPD